MIEVQRVIRDDNQKVVRVEATVDHYLDFVFVRGKDGKIHEVLSSQIEYPALRARLLKKVYGVFSSKKKNNPSQTTFAF